MRTVLTVAVAISLLPAAIIAAFWGYGLHTHYAERFSDYPTRGAAERAASAGRAADFDVDVEEGGPGQRRPNSIGARRIAVTFSTGETGDDATSHRKAFRAIVAREDGRFGHPGGGCLERTPFN